MKIRVPELQNIVNQYNIKTTAKQANGLANAIIKYQTENNICVQMPNHKKQSNDSKKEVKSAPLQLPQNAQPHARINFPAEFSANMVQPKTFAISHPTSTVNTIAPNPNIHSFPRPHTIATTPQPPQMSHNFGTFPLPTFTPPVPPTSMYHLPPNNPQISPNYRPPTPTYNPFAQNNFGLQTIDTSMWQSYKLCPHAPGGRKIACRGTVKPETAANNQKNGARTTEAMWRCKICVVNNPMDDKSKANNVALKLVGYCSTHLHQYKQPTPTPTTTAYMQNMFQPY